MRRNHLVVVAAALPMVTDRGSAMQAEDPTAAAAEAEVVAEVTRKSSSHWERCRSGVEAWGAEEEGKAGDSPSL
jgi:hypothetical protein